MEIIYISPYETAPFYEAYRDAEIITEVDSEHQGNLIDEFKKISCSTQYLDPIFSVCNNVIRITYEDGTLELLSDLTIAIYDGSEWQFRSHVIDEDAFNALIDKVCTK